MLPLADTHVHLLTALDDGPRTDDEALALCRQLVAQGVGSATALAHQNVYFPNTPDAVRTATRHLIGLIAQQKIPLSVYPTGEIVASSELVAEWDAGQLLSFGDHKKYLLVELPHGLFLDLRPAARDLAGRGVKIIVAHAERYPELLHDPSLAAEWAAAGMLLQITTAAFARSDLRDEQALRTWANRGLIHLLGSDGHRLDTRPPSWADGFRAFTRWVGEPTAEKIGGIWGSAVLQGLTINPPPPKPPTTSWFAKLFGV